MKATIQDRNFKVLPDAKVCFSFDYKGYEISTSNLIGLYFEVVVFKGDDVVKCFRDIQDAIEHVDNLVYEKATDEYLSEDAR